MTARGAWRAATASAPLVALSGCGDGAELGLRAAAVVGALLATLLLVRARRRGTDVDRPLHVEARAPLGRDAGVALVQAGGDRLVIGWGRDGVRLLARLDRTEAAP